jgi:hypothetical protein
VIDGPRVLPLKYRDAAYKKDIHVCALLEMLDCYGFHSA